MVQRSWSTLGAGGQIEKGIPESEEAAIEFALSLPHAAGTEFGPLPCRQIGALDANIPWGPSHHPSRKQEILPARMAALDLMDAYRRLLVSLARAQQRGCRYLHLQRRGHPVWRGDHSLRTAQRAPSRARPRDVDGVLAPARRRPRNVSPTQFL